MDFVLGKKSHKIAEDYKNSATMGPLIHNQDEINRLKNDYNVGLYSSLNDVKIMIQLLLEPMVFLKMN